MRRLVGMLAAVALMFSLGAGFAAPDAAAAAITVGSKNFTEQLILGELMVQALEAAGHTVNNRLSLGGTAVVRQALEAGEIDVYAEYTGTGLLVHFSGYGLDIPRAVWANAEASTAFVQAVDSLKNDLVWLCPATANNTYAIAVRRAWAEENNIRTAEDLAAYHNSGGRIIFASNAEFIDRPDGLQAFEETYGFSIPRSDVVVLAQGSYATAQALANGSNGVNAAMVFGTDGTIAAFDLLVVEDTLGAMPVYYPAPVVRGELLRAEPGIADVLCGVFAHLDGPTLSALNAEVDVMGRRPAEVAAEFLRQIGVTR